MFTRIISFIFGNPILIIIILGGAFNAAVRISQKAKEQRARREAQARLAQQQRDLLRTGQSATQASAIPSAPAQDPEAIRKQRIEALRQQRIAQLRALREQRTASTPSASASAPSGSSQPPGMRSPIPTPTAPRSRSQPQPRQAARQTSQQAGQQAGQPRQMLNIPKASRPKPPQGVQRSAPRAQRPQSSTTPSRASNPFASEQSLTAESASPSQRRRGAPRKPQVVEPPVLRTSLKTPIGKGPKPSTRPRSAVASARGLMRSRASIKQAVIMNEILDAPVALRRNDIVAGSLFH